MEFCPTCGELIVVDPINSKDTLVFRCNQCNKVVEGKGTMIVYDKDYTIDQKYMSLINHACEDITNPRKYGSCPKCNKDSIMVYIRLPDTLKSINICCQCRTVVS